MMAMISSFRLHSVADALSDYFGFFLCWACFHHIICLVRRDDKKGWRAADQMNFATSYDRV